MNRRTDSITLVLLLCAQVLGVINCAAQTTGEVRIRTVPEGAPYVLDGKYRMTDRQVTLTEGDHRFVFWAPEHQMLDTQVFVMGNWTLDLNIRLQRTVDFVEHKTAVQRFEKQQRLAKVVPPIIAAGVGAWAAFSIIQYGKANSELKELADEYRNSSDPDGILELKEARIPEAKDRFKSARTTTYISSGLFAASLGAAAYIRHRVKQRTPPVYEDKERVRFEGLVWLPRNSGGTWATMITIPIK